MKPCDTDKRKRRARDQWEVKGGGESEGIHLGAMFKFSSFEASESVAVEPRNLEVRQALRSRTIFPLKKRLWTLTN